MIWFNRPGTASALTPRVGIVQAWITSAEVAITRIWVFKGATNTLSASKSRLFIKFDSSEGII
jgi:hypothetical protein